MLRFVTGLTDLALQVAEEVEEEKGYSIVPTQNEIQCQFIDIDYDVNGDNYIRRSNGNQIISGWKTMAFQKKNVFRKEEFDHRMRYLSRTAGSSKGLLSWKVDLRCTDFEVDFVNVLVNSATFENGSVHWNVVSGPFSTDVQPGRVNNFNYQQVGGSKDLTLKANISGGRGTHGWQHAQLFRTNMNSNNIQFKLMVKLRRANPGFQPQGFQPPGCQPQGFQPPGFQPSGFQPSGFQPPGFQPQGFQPPGYQPPGYQPQGFQPQGFQPPNYQPSAPPYQPQAYQPQAYQPPACQPPIQKQYCFHCKSTGRKGGKQCFFCEGKGGQPVGAYVPRECSFCNGTGNNCFFCNNTVLHHLPLNKLPIPNLPDKKESVLTLVMSWVNLLVVTALSLVTFLVWNEINWVTLSMSLCNLIVAHLPILYWCFRDRNDKKEALIICNI